MWGRLLFNPLQTVHKSEFCLYCFPLGTIGRLNPSANRGSKLTGSSLWPLLLHFVVCSCWRRRTNAWKWSCPEPRWRWPRPRWRRTRCCTRWKTWESTPARGTSSLLSPPYTWPTEPAKAPPTCILQGRRSRLGRPMEGRQNWDPLSLTPPSHIHLSNEPPCDCEIRNNSMKQCRDCLKSHFECLPSVLCSPLVEI